MKELTFTFISNEMHGREDIFSFEFFLMYLFVRLIHYFFCGLGGEGDMKQLVKYLEQSKEITYIWTITGKFDTGFYEIFDENN